MAGRLKNGSPLDKKVLAPVTEVKKPKKAAKKAKKGLKKVLGL